MDKKKKIYSEIKILTDKIVKILYASENSVTRQSTKDIKREQKEYSDKQKRTRSVPRKEKEMLESAKKTNIESIVRLEFDFEKNESILLTRVEIAISGTR